jgi:4-aminobutyrate aminotransferase-like enzyme
MGNGHPISAVITTPAIAEAFFEKGYYFSTFAGNPVSTAAGTAVLDVMESEQLPARAERVGGYLRARLRDLARSHAEIGDVRGPGLFIGVELVDADGNPDGRNAARVVDALRRRRVLVGLTGPRFNVLKVRPPLAFGESHADLVVEALAATLAER